MVIQKLPVLPNQYYTGIYKKKFIFLHHTAGSSAASAVAHWNSKPDRIATPYIIERDGTIYETFDPKYWAYALGVKGATSMEKASIHIELVSWGGLTVKNGKFYSYTGKEIRLEEQVSLNWRGSKVYHEYTEAQVNALKELLSKLCMDFGIPRSTVPKFWEYQNPFKLEPGIWSHTTVRKDKQDIQPQIDLVNMVLNPC